MNKNIDVNLSEIANGAVQEAFENAFKQVLNNVHDLNTEPEKERKVMLDIKVRPNENRDILTLTCTAKAKLVPRISVGTTLLTDAAGTEVHAKELKSGVKGQTFYDTETGEVLEDDGKPIKNNVTDINNKLFK